MGAPPNKNSTITPRLSLKYTIADLIKDVNPSNGDFFRYIPDEHLDSEQLKSKKEAYNIGKIKEVPFHGIGEDKITSILAVKDVIEKGKIINKEENWKGRGYDTYVIIGKGSVNNSPSVVGVVVKSYPNTKMNNKFYVHEVIKIRDATDAAADSGVTNVIEASPFDNSVTEEEPVVNSNSKQNNEKS